MAGPYEAPRDYQARGPAEMDRFGLFSVAAFPDTDARWLNGLEWEPVRGGKARGRVAACVDLDYNEQLVPEAGEPYASALPFVVAGEYMCKAASRSVEEAEERALDHLAVGEQRAVEHAVATGELGNEPAFPVATVLGGGPVELPFAVGLLEEALSEVSGQVGVLHAQRRFAAHIAAKDFTASGRARGETMETKLGNLWSFGGGYTGTQPEGQPAASPNQFWMYATLRPMIFRSEPWIQPDEEKYLDRATNDLVILAQRHYLVTWPYETFAVLVDLS